MWDKLKNEIAARDFKSLARAISLVENEVEGYEDFLISLPTNEHTQVIGLTGPPGAGKSTLTDALIEKMIAENKKVAVLCIDPSSPFNLGALLGDRIRLSQWYTQPNVFIRSLASRGSLGGLNPKIIEIVDVVKFADFDFIIVETVGVGQSEIEIAGLADTTVVVLVPESGDEIQTMKAGLMEIADIFVVNKSDRPGADLFLKNLRQMLAPVFQTQKNEIPIIPTIADQKKGIDDIFKCLINQSKKETSKKNWLLTEKVYQLIQRDRMKDIDKKKLSNQILKQKTDWNLYRFIKQYKK
jgi:LAO/AO transport system kinase